MPDYPSSAADPFEKRNSKGQPNGYASLDATGHIPASQIIDVDVASTGGISPSSTVVAGTTFGQVAAAGVSLNFSPGDHSHGTPTAPIIPSFNQSATAPALATGGTIATGSLTSTRVAPIAAVTGVILAVGAVPSVLYVLNESVYGITFAPAATSHVAGGTSVAVGAFGCCPMVWNSATGLWHAVGGGGVASGTPAAVQAVTAFAIMTTPGGAVIVAGSGGGGSIYNTDVYNTAIYA